MSDRALRALVEKLIVEMRSYGLRKQKPRRWADELSQALAAQLEQPKFPPVLLQDGKSPEWTCPTCGGDLLFCGHKDSPALPASPLPTHIAGAALPASPARPEEVMRRDELDRQTSAGSISVMTGGSHPVEQHASASPARARLIEEAEEACAQMQNRAVLRRGMFDASDRDGMLLDQWRKVFSALLVQITGEKDPHP